MSGADDQEGGQQAQIADLLQQLTEMRRLLAAAVPAGQADLICAGRAAQIARCSTDNATKAMKRADLAQRIGGRWWVSEAAWRQHLGCRGRLAG